MEYIHQVTEEMIAKAKETAQGAKIQLLELTLDDGRIFEGVFKVPSNLSVKRYTDSVGPKLTKVDVSRHQMQFIAENTIFPDKDTIVNLLDELPLMVIGLMEELMKGHGFVENSKKKLL